VIAPLRRIASNPVLVPEDVPFARCSGVFNAGAVADAHTGRVVMLFRAYETDTGRSSIGCATSEDGVTFDDIRARPALGRVEPYEEWGVEDPRVTWLASERCYAITYTGHSPAGPKLCLATTDDLLDPSRYRRHGPRLATENKNGVVFPEKTLGRYAVLHRPMPRIVLARVGALQDPWPADGAVLLGPRAGTWRSSRVGAGAPPLRTRIGWLLAFHGATEIAAGNVYSMGWCVLDADDPARVLYVSREPALAPEAAYEIHHAPLPQVDMANFPGGIRVVFPCGLVERGADLIVYYGAADRVVAAARVEKEALVDSLEAAIAHAEGDVA
jgi:predicted GH43/DUF377 family glycosyl hydrolase